MAQCQQQNFLSLTITTPQLELLDRAPTINTNFAISVFVSSSQESLGFFIRKVPAIRGKTF